MPFDSGDGDGYGYGDGSGSGYGDGDGYGYGDGSGSGSGSGYGYGYGSGSGYGDGDGYGDEIGQVGGYPVIVLTPWPFVQVGCEIHSLDRWSKRWGDIAAANRVDVDRVRFNELMTAAKHVVRSSQSFDS